jgi:hypothetical protein
MRRYRLRTIADVEAAVKCLPNCNLFIFCHMMSEVIRSGLWYYVQIRQTPAINTKTEKCQNRARHLIFKVVFGNVSTVHCIRKSERRTSLSGGLAGFLSIAATAACAIGTPILQFPRFQVVTLSLSSDRAGCAGSIDVHFRLLFGGRPGLGDA